MGLVPKDYARAELNMQGEIIALFQCQDKRRRRDELLKEQKAAKLAKLKEAKLSADFLQSLETSAKVCQIAFSPEKSVHYSFYLLTEYLFKF